MSSEFEFNWKRLPANCLSVFDHFVKLALKGLRSGRISVRILTKRRKRNIFQKLLQMGKQTILENSKTFKILLIMINHICWRLLFDQRPPGPGLSIPIHLFSLKVILSFFWCHAHSLWRQIKTGSFGSRITHCFETVCSFRSKDHALTFVSSCIILSLLFWVYPL